MGCFSSKPTSSLKSEYDKSPSFRPRSRRRNAPYPTSASASQGSLARLPPDSDGSARSQKLRRLHTSGVMVLIDAANVEIEGQKLSWELSHGTQGTDRSWRLHYAHLLQLIASHASPPDSDSSQSVSPPRRVVAAHLVSSEKHLIRQRYKPGRKSWGRLGITFTIPSARNIPGTRGRSARRNSRDHRRFSPHMHPLVGYDEPATVGEKAVDHTLVRIMTQEFEGLHLLHPSSETRPRRTFALVSGDFDYVDVVDQARMSGCDVEIWYWTGRQSLSNQWVREESRRHDDLGTLTFHDLRENFAYLTASEEALDNEEVVLPGDRPDRLSFSSDRSRGSGTAPLSGGLAGALNSGGVGAVGGGGSAGLTPSGLQLSGATGRRRFFGAQGRVGGTGQLGTPEFGAVPGPEVAAAAIVDEMAAPVTPSPVGSVSSSSVMSSSLMGQLVLPQDQMWVTRCGYREFCKQDGCMLRHTEAERKHFALHGGKGRYRLAKTKLCKGGRLCKDNERRFGVCPFLHEGEERLCVRCLRVHEERECEAERGRPINPLEARPLVKEGYLVDLLVTKAAVAGGVRREVPVLG